MFDSDIQLRRAVPEDALALSHLGIVTFSQTFPNMYSEDDVAEYVSTQHSEKYYLDAITETSNQLWVLHDSSDALCGYLLYGKCTLPFASKAPDAMEIKRLYLERDVQGSGFGSLLINTALEEYAAGTGSELYVGVYSENYRAQSFYTKFGFVVVGEYLFPVGSHRDLEYIMRLDRKEC